MTATSLTEGVEKIDMRLLPYVAVTPAGPSCLCVARHVPTPRTLEHHHIWPQGHGGPTVAANLIWLCGTSHNNVHHCLDELLAHGGELAEARLYNAYTRGLAELGYRRIRAQKLVD